MSRRTAHRRVAEQAPPRTSRALLRWSRIGRNAGSPRGWSYVEPNDTADYGPDKSPILMSRGRPEGGAPAQCNSARRGDVSAGTTVARSPALRLGSKLRRTSSSQVNAALVASFGPPRPTPNRVALVSQLAAAAADFVLVERAARDRAVSVQDQTTGTVHRGPARWCRTQPRE
jgi:hypothetical protein